MNYYCYQSPIILSDLIAFRTKQCPRARHKECTCI